MEKLLFDSWESTFRTFIITVLAYFSMIFLLRISGKRTLSKMNAFDFVVTVALGSALAAVALNKSIALTDGAMAFFTLIFLQFVLTWLSVRVKAVKNIITAAPTMLLYKGELLHGSLKRERITEEEISMAARKKGITDLKEIDVVVLETTGDITIIKNTGAAASGTLSDVAKHH